MKYYRLMKYAGNPAGAVFVYCREDELDIFINCFTPDKTEEISKMEYDWEKEKEYIKNYRLATGYPKR